MSKNKIYLIYAADCSFCKHVAFSLMHLFAVDGLEIVPNTSKRALGLSSKLTRSLIRKDVHVIINENKKINIFSGADAVAKVLSKKDRLMFLWKIHLIFPWLFRSIYYITKKIKKYLN